MRKPGRSSARICGPAPLKSPPVLCLLRAAIGPRCLPACVLSSRLRTDRLRRRPYPAQALSSIGSGDAAAVQGGYSGWVLPYSYAAARQLMASNPPPPPGAAAALHSG